MYRLFYTDYVVPKAQYHANKPRLMVYAYNELDDALGKARQIKAHGGVPWEIESDDGTTLGCDEIGALLRDRSAELVGRPKVY
jgi:hypothetical protein